MNKGGFYAFKTLNYGLQERLISKKAPQKEKGAKNIAAKKKGLQKNVLETEKSSSQKVAHMFTWLIMHPKTGSGVFIYKKKN